MTKELFRQASVYLYLSVAFILVFFIVENINGRFWLNDFRVYYGASEAFLNGDNLYYTAFGLGSGNFKYSPLAASLFIPFSLLPYKVASTVFYFLIGAVIVYLPIRLVNLNTDLFSVERSVKRNKLLIISFLICAVHFYRELHLGNINMMLLLLFIGVLHFTLKNKPIYSGLLLALGLLIKPHFLVLIPFFLLRKQYKTIVVALVGIGIGLLIPFLFVGWSGNLELLNNWWVSMTAHNDVMIYKGGDDINSVNTVYSFVYRSFGKYISTNDATWILSMLVVIGVSVLTLMLRNFKIEQKNSSSREKHIVFEYLLIIALIPSIVLTDTEHFLLVLPLLIFILNYALGNGLKVVEWIILIVILLMFGGNWRDLLGETLSKSLSYYGLLGVANLLIIGFSVYCFSFRKKESISDL